MPYIKDHSALSRFYQDRIELAVSKQDGNCCANTCV